MVFLHWDDVVFENRNKSYGAYLLRRAYANRLLLGECITIALFALILSLRNFSGDDSIRPEDPAPLEETSINLTHPPSFKDEEPPKKTTRPPKTNSQNRTVLVTKEDVIDEPETEAPVYYNTEGFANGDIGTIEGIGTIPVAEVEAVIEPVRDLAEVMPRYEGGLEAMMKFIQKKIRYPRAPQKTGTSSPRIIAPFSAWTASSRVIVSPSR